MYAADGNQYRYAITNAVLLPVKADINHRITRTTLAGGQLTHTVLTEDNVFTQYGIDGLPTSKRWPNGEFITYTYSSSSTPASVAPRSGLLLAMTDQNGRSLSMSYNPDANLKTLTDPNGGVIQYTYDEAHGNCPADIVDGKCMRLTSVTYPDGKVRRYHYNEATHVDPSLDMGTAYLTGITDETGLRLSDYKYDDEGKAISSGWGGFDYQLAYSGNTTAVTDPLGTQRVTTYQEILGRKYAVGQDQPGGSGGTAANSAVTYDTNNGNKTSEDDFTGKRVCYAYDPTRNLRTARVEGLIAGTNCTPLIATNAVLPTGSRKMSTLWHPDRRLASRVAEPRQITTYVYNGQPDPTAGNAVASCAPAGALLPDGKPIAVLCKKVEQATTDANGAAGFAATAESGVVARVWKWTYNNIGQVLSEDGPRTDVSDVTNYSYHTATAFTGTNPNAVGVTVGDLKSITNAAGKTTNYTKYNKHGQLIESTDPNGLVSSYAYDLRQRLLSVTVSGQTTSYTYDGVGQLKRITRPDTSWIGYDYDPARRLKAVYDNLGNRIDYTLDNAGNRTAENVKDTGGALKRQIARSIDALGRVQQTTGLE